LYHWFPVEALLESTLPVRVTTGAGGVTATVTGKLGEAVPLPQALAGTTLIFPEEAELLKATSMNVVLFPEVMVAPGGRDHV
jgi:hypothetical protein